jgi:hypothetical protein
MAQILTDEELDSILREKYAGPNGALRLAQNLISIFGATHPDGQTVDGPITFRQPRADVPALVVEPFPNATVPALAGGGGGGGETPSQGRLLRLRHPRPGRGHPGVPDRPVRHRPGEGGRRGVPGHLLLRPHLRAAPRHVPGHPGPDRPGFETIPSGTEVLVWCSVGSGFKVGEMRMIVPVFLPT